MPRLRPWVRTARESVATFRIFELERGVWNDADGKPRGDGYVLRCRDWCNVVAVTPEDEVILVWQYRFGTDGLSLEIPGGVIDQGEEPIVAAGRELLEETGYEGESIEPLVTVEPTRPSRSIAASRSSCAARGPSRPRRSTSKRSSRPCCCPWRASPTCSTGGR
jgi:8-oxo-dGTP pyrophosphatase MutT (NUDIX family)